MSAEQVPEKIFRRSKNALIIQLITSVILIPVFGIGIILGIAILIQYFTHELIVRQKSIIHKKGWIGSYTKEIPFSKINGVNVDQGVGGRLFNYGSVKVVTGNDTDTIKFDTIDSPEKVKKLIQKLVEQNDPAHSHNKSASSNNYESTDKFANLEKLADMKQKGIITEDEFRQEKKKLLGN